MPGAPPSATRVPGEGRKPTLASSQKASNQRLGLESSGRCCVVGFPFAESNSGFDNISAPTRMVEDRAAIFQSRKMTTKYAALVVLLCSVVLPRHVAGGAETGGALVFRDARVFDGAQVLPRATVLVRNGRIAAVGGKGIGRFH